MAGTSAQNVFRIMILGEGGVGKSAITLQLIHNYFEESWDPTIEDTYEKDVVMDGRPCRLDILDTSGQDEYLAMRDANMRQRDGFLLVFGVDDGRTADALDRVRQHVLRVKEETDERTPIVVVANKSDLLDEVPGAHAALERGHALARQWKVPFVETSAKTRAGVDTAFQSLVRLMRELHAGGRTQSSRSPVGTGRSNKSPLTRVCPCCAVS